MSSLRDALGSTKFLVTAAAPSPKGADPGPLAGSLRSLAGRVDAVNLPEGRSARIHLCSLAACVTARKMGLEPIFTLSCRDRNRIALCADLLGAHALGVRNVLCVSGDYVTFGDAPDAKPVYDLDSVQAIQLARGMEEGLDAGGNELEGAPAFCVGCAANPQARPLEPHLLKLYKKLAAGAEFIQTLDIYDMEAALPFFEKLKERDIPVLAGLRLVTRRTVELWESGKLPGNPIPGPVCEEVKGSADSDGELRKALSRLAAMIRRVRESGLCRGVHLTLEGHEDQAGGILEEAGVGSSDTPASSGGP